MDPDQEAHYLQLAAANPHWLCSDIPTSKILGRVFLCRRRAYPLPERLLRRRPRPMAVPHPWHSPHRPSSRNGCSGPSFSSGFGPASSTPAASTSAPIPIGKRPSSPTRASTSPPAVHSCTVLPPVPLPAGISDAAPLPRGVPGGLPYCWIDCWRYGFTYWPLSENPYSWPMSAIPSGNGARCGSYFSPFGSRVLPAKLSLTCIPGSLLVRHCRFSARVP